MADESKEVASRTLSDTELDNAFGGGACRCDLHGNPFHCTSYSCPIYGTSKCVDGRVDGKNIWKKCHKAFSPSCDSSCDRYGTSRCVNGYKYNG